MDGCSPAALQMPVSWRLEHLFAGVEKVFGKGVARKPSIGAGLHVGEHNDTLNTCFLINLPRLRLIEEAYPVLDFLNVIFEMLKRCA